MPKSVAQLTGMLVTAIVTFGTDLDAIWSVPLGLFAGGVALFFVSMSEASENFRKLPGTVRVERRGDRRRS
jgi:hypothetical protein